MQRLELFVKTSSGKVLSMRELELLVDRGEVSRKTFEEKQREYEDLKQELEGLLKQIRQGSKKFQVRQIPLCKRS
jgi:hypothetical protein